MSLNNESIFYFKEAEKELGSNSKIDSVGNKVRWLNIKAICVGKASDSYRIKYNLKEPYVEVAQVATRKSGGKFSTLKLKYEGPLPISAAKKRDLVNMCKSGIIPKDLHPFYDSINVVND